MRPAPAFLRPLRPLRRALLGGVAAAAIIVACIDFPITEPFEQPRLIALLEVEIERAALREGDVVMATATVRDQDGNPFTELPPGAELVWHTSDAAVVTVDGGGEVRARRAGAAVITAAVITPQGEVAAAVDVQVSPRWRLGFVTQPTAFAAGTTMEPVVATIQDESGAVPAEAERITIALDHDPTEQAVLSGTLSVDAVEGTAVFEDLSIDLAGVGYTLVVSSGDLEPAVSDSFDVTAGEAARLTFTQQPAATIPGVTMAPLVLRVEDVSGNPVPWADTVRIALAGDAGEEAVLSGTLRVAAVDGVATFADLSIDRPGTGYRLEAMAEDLASVVSEPFDVVVGEPARLAFEVELASLAAGDTLAPVVVRIEDEYGNLTPAAMWVSVALGADPATGASLSGTLGVHAAGGRARFEDLSIDHAGVGYTLVAAAEGLASATSASFDVLEARAVGAELIGPAQVVAGAMSDLLSLRAVDARGHPATVPDDVLFTLEASRPGRFYAAAGDGEPITALTIPAGGSEASFRYLAEALGEHQLRATSEPLGAADHVLMATVGVAARLVFDDEPASTRAGDVMPPVRVGIEDAYGNRVPDAGVVMMALGTDPAGESTLGGTLSVEAVEGVARFEDLSIDQAGVGFTLVASADGLSSATSGAFEITPRAAILVSDLVLTTFSAGTMTLTLTEPAGPDGLEVLLSSDAPEIAAVPARVSLARGQATAEFSVTSDRAVGVATVTASATDYIGGSGIVDVTARSLRIEMDRLVGIGRTNPALVVLAEPAPNGGVTVALASSDPAIVSVDPASVQIAAGDTAAAFTVTGHAEGSVVITAAAEGFGFADTAVELTGTNTTVSIGSIPPLAPGERRSLPVSLSEPAPAAGVTILLESSDVDVAVVDPKVDIRGGAQLPDANPQVTGVNTGTAVITARASGFAPDARIATVQPPGLTISPDPATIYRGWTHRLTLSSSWPAPSGGLVVRLASEDPEIFTVSASATIPAGQTSVTFPVTGVSVGNSTVTAEADGASGTSASVRVRETPTVSVGSATVGRDLQIGVGVSLGATPLEPVDMTITIADGSAALISASRTGVGGTSVTFTGVTNTSSRTLYVQGLEEGATTTLTARAADYIDGQSTVTVMPSGFHLTTSNFTTTTFSSNTNITVGSYRLQENGNLSTTQELRAGLTVEIPVTSSDPAVGSITTSPLVFTAGGGSTRTTQFNPHSGGTSTVSITYPEGFPVPANGRTSLEATVTAPNISMGSAVVGADLQTSIGVSLTQTPPEPVDITVTVADGSAALISASRTGVGSTSVTFTGVFNTSSRTVYVQGLEEGATTTLTARAAGFNDGQSTVTVMPSGFHLTTSSVTTTTFSSNTNITVGSYRLQENGNLSTTQELRPGVTVEVPVASSDPAVGSITTSPLVFTGGGSSTRTTQFDPHSGGTSTVSITHPEGFRVPANGRTSLEATVTAPNISMGNAVVGADLQTSIGVSLTQTPPEPVDVTVTVADGSAALISASRTGVGSTSVTFTGVGNTSSRTLYVQGLEEGATTTLTARAAGFNDGQSTVTVMPSGFHLTTSSFTTTTFSSNSNITVGAYRLQENGNLSTTQELRAGMTVEIPVASSDPAVGSITTSPLVFTGGGGSTRTTQFNPLTAGTSTVSITYPEGFPVPANGRTSLEATVTAPNISMGTVVVGADLQTSIGVSLTQAPPEPVDITITITAPSAALISTSRTEVGSTSVTFTGVGNTSSRTLYVQGLEEGATTTLTARAAGYNDGQSTVTVMPSGFHLATSNFTTTTFSSNTNITVGAYRLQENGHLSTAQELRPGMTVEIPVASSDPAVGSITTSPLVFTGGGGSSRTTQFNPLTLGTSTVSITHPDGFRLPVNGRTALEATVTAPNISMGSAVVGKDLQTSIGVSLTQTPPEPVDITVTVADGSAVLISTSRTEVGSTSVTFTGVGNTSSRTLYVQGLEDGAMTTLTARAAGFNDGQSTVTVMPSGFHLTTPDFTTTTTASNTGITVGLYRLQENGSLSTTQELRPGMTVEVPVTSSDPAVGSITISPLVFTGAGGSSRATQFNPLTAGTSTVSITHPDGFRVPINGRTALTATVTGG